jgi:mevalonate kinase
LTARSTPTPPRTVSTSAPGKLILAGEHAAVYGRPALVAAVDARLRVQARADDGGGAGPDGVGDRRGEVAREAAAGGVADARATAPVVVLDLADLGVVAGVTGADLRTYAAAARQRWQAFAADPTPERFRALRGGDPAHLVKVALGETLLAHGSGAEPRWTLRVESAIPVGGGMGSSAAAAAALIAAALRLLGRAADLELVEPLLIETERRQHGSPSGVDGAIVLRGGVQWVERSPSGELRFEALPASLPLLDRIRVVDTGTPEQATGEVVAAVRQLRAADAAEFDRLLDRLEDATRRLRDALVAGDGPGLASAIHQAQRGLERAGVVPLAVRELARRIEARGGAAKVSGAGALRGAGAGCLLVYHPHPATLELGDLVAPESVLPVRLGAEGLREEPA